MLKRITLILSFVIVSIGVWAQIPIGREFIVQAVIYKGDTIPFYSLPEVAIYAMRKYKNPADEKRFQRLVYNVKKVYPYAKVAGQKYRYYDSLLLATPEKKRKAMMNKAEDEIKKEFEADLRKLTFSQGKILIKLVHRETKTTSYVLLQDFRGDFRAFFYQGIGRLFGYNLKTNYDLTRSEDQEIEMIIQMIERKEI